MGQGFEGLFMTGLLDEPRIAYASRKVQRFREDVEEWESRFAALAVQVAWEDLIRDANRIARDLLALDRKSLEMFSTSSLPTSVGLKHLQLLATGIAEWSKSASRILDHVAAVGESSVEVEGLYELRGHVEAAKKINMTPPLERAFRELVRVWEQDTYYFSSTTQIVSHQAFQRIVELGNLVVPLLLTEIGSHPSHLVIALRRITGVDPVPLEDRGKFPAMAEAWVKWGEARQLV
jgi:hypothetical protein